jgi:hypothetical protein
MEWILIGVRVCKASTSLKEIKTEFTMRCLSKCLTIIILVRNKSTSCLLMGNCRTKRWINQCHFVNRCRMLLQSKFRPIRTTTIKCSLTRRINFIRELLDLWVHNYLTDRRRIRIFKTNSSSLKVCLLGISQAPLYLYLLSPRSFINQQVGSKPKITERILTQRESQLQPRRTGCRVN